MPPPALPWPTKQEYDLAIQDWRHTLRDPELQQAQLNCYPPGSTTPRSFGGAGLYSTVYRLDRWMVRCFCSTVQPPRNPPIDIRERYIAIDRFTHERSQQAHVLLPINYVKEGITVGSRTLPIVKMPFVENGLPLGSFIETHHTNTVLMQNLATAWLQMITTLESPTVRMAHGDLDLTNVLVLRRGTTVRLKLIDYDNMWIPTLAARAQTEGGHEAFQHPAFLKRRSYDETMDRFSALVIYLSLGSLAVDSKLFEDFGADESERLLLSWSDYAYPDSKTGQIMQLRTRCGPVLHPYVDELRDCLREQRLPRPLSQIGKAAPKPPRPVRPPVQIGGILPIPPPSSRPTTARVDVAARSQAVTTPLNQETQAPPPSPPPPTTKSGVSPLIMWGLGALVILVVLIVVLTR